jgi:hypothetical protein
MSGADVYSLFCIRREKEVVLTNHCHGARKPDDAYQIFGLSFQELENLVVSVFAIHVLIFDEKGMRGIVEDKTIKRRES